MDEHNPENRRMLVRRPGNTIATLRLRGGATELVAEVHDISILGIGILASHHIAPGTSLVLEPAESIQKLRPELRAEVRHATTWQHGKYLIGCRFSRLLTTTDALALG